MAQEAGVSRRLYRLLLRAYPRAFRARFGGDMAAAFADLVGERSRAAGPRAVLALWVRTVVDVITNAAAEHARARGARGPWSHRPRKWNGFMGSVRDDLKYAWRGIRHAPGVTLVVVMTLALAVGAAVCILSLVRAVVLRPLPYANPEGLLTIWVERSTK